MATLSRPVQWNERSAREARLLAQRDRYPGFLRHTRQARAELIAVRQTEASKVELEQCFNPIQAWRGTIQPFATTETEKGVAWLIADLAANRQVGLLPNGTLAHLAECGGPHDLAPELIPARKLTEAYTVEIAARVPPGLPVIRAIDPRICPEAIEGSDGQPLVQEPFRPPHLHWKIEALCITFPSDREWTWGQGVVADSLDQTAIWLAKHTLWEESRERLGRDRGIWIGNASTHDEFSFIDRLNEVRPNDRCHCGTAETYSHCCQIKDLTSAHHYTVSMVRDPWLAAVRLRVGRFAPQFRDGAAMALQTGAASIPPCCWWTAARSMEQGRPEGR